MTERETPYPTIARLAEITVTVGYQGHEIVREAIECYRALAAANERAERLMAGIGHILWLAGGEASCGQLGIIRDYAFNLQREFVGL